MTNFTKNIMVAAAALVLAGVASAQTLQANIPFAFRIGDKLMQPGTYHISMLGNTGADLYKLTNLDQGDAAIVLAKVAQDARKEWRLDPKPRLAFECGETRCALAELWNGVEGSPSRSFNIPKAKHEATRLAVVVARPLKGE